MCMCVWWWWGLSCHVLGDDSDRVSVGDGIMPLFKATLGALSHYHGAGCHLTTFAPVSPHVSPSDGGSQKLLPL